MFPKVLALAWQRRAATFQHVRQLAHIESLPDALHFFDASWRFDEKGIRSRPSVSLASPQRLIHAVDLALLRPSELEELGFRIVIYGISPLMHAVRAMQKVLDDLSRGEIDFAGGGVGFEEYKSIVGFDRWAEVENRYQPPTPKPAL